MNQVQRFASIITTLTRPSQLNAVNVVSVFELSRIGTLLYLIRNPLHDLATRRLALTTLTRTYLAPDPSDIRVAVIESSRPVNVSTSLGRNNHWRSGSANTALTNPSANESIGVAHCIEDDADGSGVVMRFESLTLNQGLAAPLIAGRAKLRSAEPLPLHLPCGPRERRGVLWLLHKEEHHVRRRKRDHGGP